MLHLAAFVFWVKDQAGTSDSRNMLPFEVKSVLNKKKKNINKLKLCLQTDLCLKGCKPLIWRISGDSGNYSKPSVLFKPFWKLREVHPAVQWYTGFWVWRWEVINRCEANVWDPIFMIRWSKVQLTVPGAWHTRPGQAVFGILMTRSTNWTCGAMETGGIKKNNLSGVKLEAVINHGPIKSSFSHWYIDNSLSKS